MIFCQPSYTTPVESLLQRYGLRVEWLASGSAIPGSYWGMPEAGLIGKTVYLRPDTPLHSALHETAHVICMDNERRAALHTDAGGEFCEEDAVCYLQILLAQQLGVSIETMCADMDEWGYTFRLGSAHAWFTQDARDARDWLLRHELITSDGSLTWNCRGAESPPAVANSSA